MKKSTTLWIFLSVLLFNCGKENYINSSGFVAGTSYFAFEDKVKQEHFQAQRVVLVDTKTQKQYKLLHTVTGIHSIKNGKVLFQLFNNLTYSKAVFVNGKNTFQLVFPDGKTDLIDLDITFSSPLEAGGTIFYNKIIYNSNDVAAENTSEFSEKAFIYALK